MPFTHSLSSLALYVTATWLHSPAGNATLLAAAQSEPPIDTKPPARLVSVFAYRPYASPAGASFRTTLLHDWRVSGRTHASNVMPAFSRKEDVSAIATTSSRPSKARAPPYF